MILIGTKKLKKIELEDLLGDDGIFLAAEDLSPTMAYVLDSSVCFLCITKTNLL